MNTTRNVKTSKYVRSIWLNNFFLLLFYNGILPVLCVGPSFLPHLRNKDGYIKQNCKIKGASMFNMPDPFSAFVLQRDITFFMCCSTFNFLFDATFSQLASAQWPVFSNFCPKIISHIFYKFYSKLLPKIVIFTNSNRKIAFFKYQIIFHLPIMKKRLIILAQHCEIPDIVVAGGGTFLKYLIIFHLCI